MGTAQRDEYSVNRPSTSRRTWCLNAWERLGLSFTALFQIFWNPGFFVRASVRSHVISMFSVSPELYDVVIVCEDGTELQCHKCILVAQLGTYGLQT